MACEEYVPKKFRPDALAKIAQAERIIVEYQDQGLRMTLRQLYYQHVARGLIPNNDKSYRNLGTLISDARLAGLLDWDAIEDRGRRPRILAEHNSIKEWLDERIPLFRLPRWEGQEDYVELWVEKEALAGVLQPLADEFHVTMMVNKGYSSSSAMYASAERFKYAFESGEKTLRLFYLGDHDPSGEDMVRDIKDRLEIFGAFVIVEKLALTMDQVRQYDPPPNPAKITDSRAAAYIERYGDSSWEVDALPPNVLAEIIRRAFGRVIDTEVLDEVKKRERALKKKLAAAAAKIDG